jgi:DNA repair protein RecO (recombination protein O)
VATLKDEGICVRHWDWSETSQTVSVFTRTHGIVRGVAKGAKRERSSFSGGFELATRGELVAIVKQHDTDHALANLTAWDLLETFPGSKTTLTAFNVAMAMLDFVHHGLVERDPHDGVYDALVAGLRRLESPGEEVKAALVFAWTLIDQTGHRPEVFVDVGGAGALEEAALYGFDPARGAVVADQGAGGDTPVPGTIWRVRGETVRVLRSLALGSNLDSADVEQGPITRALKLLCFYFREQVGTQPPAIRAMLEGVTTGHPS